MDIRHYDYDANGNLIDHQIPTQTSQYQYDPLDRLIDDAILNQDTLQYGYDLNDNREQSASNTLNTDYLYENSSNRITEIEINRLGNQPIPTQAPRQLVYNDVGRLHQLMENNALIATYTYNAYGQRTRKVTSLGTIVYHYDQAGMLISETRADGTPIRDYIRSDGTLVAQIDSAGFEQIRYLHTDHLGTPRLATDEQGTLIWRWQGEGFGSANPEIDPDGDGLGTIINLRFPGQYFDFESGWFYNYFRYYDPSTGRYITSDPIGLDGGRNTYGYVGGNPLTYIDPQGLTKIRFNKGTGKLIVDPEIKGRLSYTLPASSGKPECDCDETTPDKGAIPTGNYYLYTKDLTNPGLVGDIARNLRGDWGDWRAPLTPTTGTNTYGRDGFFLHGGSLPGSAGCIDVGDGLFGNSLTDQLLNDILNDPDGKIPVRIRQ